MRFWMILLLVLLALWLLSYLRLGVSVDYDASGLMIRANLGRIPFKLFPMKKKKPKPRKQRNPEAAKGRQKNKGGNLALVKKYLPLAAEAAGRLKKKIRIDNIDLNLIWGSSSPAMTAISFGFANAAFGMLWPLIEHNFNVRERQLRTSVDYNATEPVMEIRAKLTLTIGQGVVIGTALGVKAIKLFRDYKKEQKLKEAV